MSIFSFIDSVSEVKKGESLTAFFSLKPGQEFLQDHFADFPVMPGVLQLECLKQAASRLLAETEGTFKYYRLAAVDSVKYGQFVKPESRLKIFVHLLDPSARRPEKENIFFHFEGRVDLVDGERLLGRAILADFSLVPVK